MGPRFHTRSLGWCLEQSRPFACVLIDVTAQTLWRDGRSKRFGGLPKFLFC